jgi:uncharacterized membrane protein YbhN (UPF0104 family)
VGDHLLRAPNPGWLALALVAVAVFLAADGLTLALLVRSQEPDIGVRAPVAVVLESNLVAGATSFGGLEIPYQIMRLRRLGLRYSSITSVLVLKALVHVSLLLVLALAAFLPAFGVPFTPTQRLLILVVVVVLAAVWAAGAIWLRRPWGLSAVPAPLRRRLDSFREAMSAVKHAGWRPLAAVVALQLVYWLAVLSVVPLVLAGLGWQGGVLSIVTRQAALQVLMPFSPLPGGAGVAELGYLGLIGATLPSSIRLSSLVLWRALTWLVPMSVGALFLGLRSSRLGTRSSRRRGLGSGTGPARAGTDRCG